MSTYKEIRYAESRTINMGNYENVKLELEGTVLLDEDDDPKKEMKSLIKQVVSLVDAKAEEYENEAGRRSNSK